MENDAGGGVWELLAPFLENPKLIGGMLHLLTASGQEQQASASGEKPTPPITQGDAARRRALLCALRPYFRPERAQKVDVVLKMLELLELLQNAEPRGGAREGEGQI